jgi:hypothetical protein
MKSVLGGYGCFLFYFYLFIYLFFFFLEESSISVLRQAFLRITSHLSQLLNFLRKKHFDIRPDLIFQTALTFIKKESPFCKWVDSFSPMRTAGYNEVLN